MDADKITQFASRYAQMDDDELLDIYAGRNHLVNEAGVALDTILSRRGFDSDTLESPLTELRNGNSAKSPRNWKLMTAQLIGLSVISIGSVALAEITPRPISAAIVLAFVAYLGYRAISRKRLPRTPENTANEQ